MTGPVRRAIVVGRDAPVWIAAVSLVRAVGRAGVKVEVVELPSLLSAVDVYPALPSLQGLHRLIGLDEGLVIAAGRGVPMSGQRFSNWSGSAPSFINGYDDTPPPGGDLDFIHYWSRARREGMNVPFEEFSFGAMVAKLGRVPVESGGDSSLSASYGYNLDARGYTNLLKQYAEHLGVHATSSTIAHLKTGAGGIEEMILESGRRIEGDLFIDASGAEAVLLSRLDGARFNSWEDRFPCDRIVAASAAPMSPLPTFSQISAMRAGWVGLFPLQHRTAVIAAYSSKHMRDDELIEALPLVAGRKISDEAIVSPQRSGCQAAPWIGNCIAIGEAAFSLEPLDAVQLYLTHVCVSNLVTFFPTDRACFPETDFYNEAVGKFADYLSAFQEARYRLNRRFDEPMWDHLREREPSPVLDRKMRMFRLRGDTIPQDYETFAPGSWTAMFVGHGLLPEGYDPRADLPPEPALIEKMQGRLRSIGAAVPAQPAAADFLDRIGRSLEQSGAIARG